MSDCIRVDFHVHTQYSADSLSSLESVIRVARRAGLDKLAITDHNTVEGAQKAHAQEPDLVIVGEEIMTTKGEILALFVSEFVPPYLPPSKTIHRLKEQGAFIAVSHPFDPLRSGWSLSDLEELAPQLDALETFNAKCFSRRMNEKAAQFAIQHDLAGLAGSDAHWPVEVGRGWMELPPFHDAESLRAVIRQGNIKGKLSGAWLRFFSPYVHLRKKVNLNFNFHSRISL